MHLLLCALALPQAAFGGDLHVGWSNLGDPLVKGPYLGGQVAAGYRHGILDWLSVEARGTYLPDLGSNRAKDLVRTLVVIAADAGAASSDFQQPLIYDTWRVEALADLAPPRDPHRLQAVPHLRIGVGVEGQHHYNATYNTGCTDPATGCDIVALGEAQNSIGLPLITEAAFELWSARSVGLRLGAGLLSELQDKPQYDPDRPVTEKRIWTRSRLGLDLVVALGAK